MPSSKASRAAPVLTGRGPRGIDLAGRQIGSVATPKISCQHAVGSIRAELFDGDRCSAEGITVVAGAPVLAICRKLIQAGHDPDRPLCAYRGGVLCLTVRSIGEAAALTVDEHNGVRFAKWKPFPVRRWRAGSCGRAGPLPP
jgi:hypothetical protein